MIFGNTGAPASHISTEATLEDEAIIMEAALYDAMSVEEIQAILESGVEANLALNDEIVTERTIVRLDRKAQISQAKQASIFTIARERNDPDMKRLLTIWRMERRLEAKLEKKYGNEAERRAKKTVEKRRRSKSMLGKRVNMNMTKSKAPKQKSLAGGVQSNLKKR